jgi:hypothetical protein
MTLNILSRHSLREAFFDALLSLSLLLLLTVLAVPVPAQQTDKDDPNQPAAQQPDNDNMNRPAAQKPDKGDVNKTPATKSENDKPQGQEPDKDEMNRPVARPAEREINRTELSAWDQFLNKHPEIDNDLKKNPSLVDDQSYLGKHLDLKTFLENHPAVRQQVKKNAAWMKREQKSEKNESPKQ